MVNSKFRKKYTRKNKKSNKKTRSKNKKSNKSTKKRIINKKRFLHKRGGRQSNPYYTNCINPDDESNQFVNELNNDNEMDETTKIDSINILIENYILDDDDEYTTSVLNEEINELDIDQLRSKILGIINTTIGIHENGSSIGQLRRKINVIYALDNILVLVPENN
jgi:hypothetical protein